MPYAYIGQKTKKKVQLLFGFTGDGYISDGEFIVRKGGRFQGWTFADLQKLRGRIRVPKPT